MLIENPISETISSEFRATVRVYLMSTRVIMAANIGVNFSNCSISIKLISMHDRFLHSVQGPMNRLAFFEMHSNDSNEEKQKKTQSYEIPLQRSDRGEI